MSVEKKFPPTYIPMDYTERSTSSVPTGHDGVLVNVCFSGSNSNQMEYLVRKGMRLEIGSLFRKMSGTSKWYKRTDADRRIWEQILADKRFCFVVETRVGTSIATRPLTLEETVADALASGKSPEQIMELVMALAAGRKPTEESEEVEESEDLA